MRRDGLRAYLEMARECYELAATPPPAGVYRQAVDERPQAGGGLPSTSRMVLLQIGIDVSRIVARHLAAIERDHGRRRAERFCEWLLTGDMSRLSYWHRMEVCADRRRLARAVWRYRFGG